MLGKLLNDFKEKMIAEDTSDNTIKNYVSDIKIFYKWYQEIGFLENIDKITHYHLNTYKDYLIHNQRKKASSINRNIQSLKKFFQFMADKKLIKENPSEKIKFLKQTKRTKPKALTKNDIHKLLSVTSHSSHGTKKRNYAIIQLLLQTGIRVGELVNLEIRDLTLHDRSGEIRIINAKGGKERTIPLNSSARKWINGLVMPESERLLVLIQWLNLNADYVYLASTEVGNDVENYPPNKIQRLREIEFFI